MLIRITLLIPPSNNLMQLVCVALHVITGDRQCIVLITVYYRKKVGWSSIDKEETYNLSSLFMNASD